MPVTLNETPAWGNVDAPVGTDPRNSASVRDPMQALASRDAWLLDRVASLAVSTLTRRTLPGSGDECVAFAARPPNAADHRSAVAISHRLVAPFTTTTAFASADLDSWDAVAAGVSADPWAIRDVVWHAPSARFVAVGAGWFHRHDGGQTSPWTSASTSLDLTGIATDGALLCACATNGQVLSSTDGTSWFPRAGAISPGLHAIAFGGGAWVALGTTGIKWSTDGIAWSTVSDSRFAEAGGHRIAYEPTLDRFIVLAPDSDGWVASINGHTGAIAWTSIAGLAWRMLCYAPSARALVSHDGVSLGLSRDGGVTWSRLGAGYAGNGGGAVELRRLTWSENAGAVAAMGFVFAGGAGTEDQLLTLSPRMP